jgi:hypothetical protein
MKLLTLLASPSAIRARAFAFIVAVFATFLVTPSLVLAKPVVTFVQGAGTTTVTSLVFNDDGTISIEADQAGHLSGFGVFNGHFAYTAFPTPTGFVLLGSGQITNHRGEQLFFAVTILEFGTDYPFVLNGLLAITGGTGRFAGATGALYISGLDEESLTDDITLQGAIITPR